MWFNGNINVNTQEISLKGGIMIKVKLKKGERLSSMNNHCGLSYKDWIALEQGKTVELEDINRFIKDKVETVTVGANKKQPKQKEEK